MNRKSMSNAISKVGKRAVLVLKILTVIFLIIPVVVAIYSSFLKSLISYLPVEGFTLEWYSFLTHRDFLSSLQRSLILGLAATSTSLFIGTLASMALARYNFKGKDLFNVFLFFTPLVVPGVVKGISLLVYFNAIGLGDPNLRLYLAHIIITLPYVVRVVYPSFYGLDRSIEEASRNLGANELQTFWKITLPLIRPGLLAAVVLGFWSSIDDIAVSIFLYTSRTMLFPIPVLTWT